MSCGRYSMCIVNVLWTCMYDNMYCGIHTYTVRVNNLEMCWMDENVI